MIKKFSYLRYLSKEKYVVSFKTDAYLNLSKTTYKVFFVNLIEVAEAIECYSVLAGRLSKMTDFDEKGLK